MEFSAHWIQDSRFADLQSQKVFFDPEHNSVVKPDLKNIHMLVRKKFTLDEKPLAARLSITADDYYKLYVNNKFVGQGPAPGYYFHYHVNDWHLEKFLCKGENVIAVHVYYQGLINRVWNSGDFRQGMIAELKVDFPKEKTMAISSDETWRVKNCPAYKSSGHIAYETQFKENIDWRLYDWRWREIDFDDTSWHKPQVQDPEKLGYKFVLQEIPPLEVYRVYPDMVKKIDEGHFLIDFGMEVTGQIGLSVNGPEGHVIEIRHAEELNEDGSIRHLMRCNCDYQDFWTLSGERNMEMEFFDYKGFRYVEILNSPSSLETDNIWVTVRHYPYPQEACIFESSLPELNKIWAICENGVKLCSQEQFMDCPTREKGQYLNDNAITTHSHMLLSGDPRLARKALQDFALSSRLYPGLLGVAPGSIRQLIADSSLQWPMQVWEYYMHSGDIDVLLTILPAIEGLVLHFEKYENPAGLLADVCDMWNLVDWPKNLRDDYDFNLDQKTGGHGCHNVLNAHYYNALIFVEKIYTVTKTECTAIRKKIKQCYDAFANTFFNIETGLFIDAVGSRHSSLHANALPLCFGLVPENRTDKIISFLKTKRMACGVSMAYYFLKGLIENNEKDFAFELLSCHDVRSWNTMVENGATACLEAWGPDQKWNTSFCHAWASAPIPLIIENIFGVKHAAPGWSKVIIEPQIPQDFPDVKLWFTVPQGRISVSCCKKGGHRLLVLNIPDKVDLINSEKINDGWKIIKSSKETYEWKIENKSL